MPSPLTRDTHVAVIGGGPGGLMAAEVLATAGAAVTVFDRMRSPGRKFLLAGRGGLNLTHTEPIEAFLDRYGPARSWLTPAIEAFGPEQLRAWCAGLGEATFVGTSGRVFPVGFRATPLLRAWLRRLGELGVVLEVQHTWSGWTDDGALMITDDAGVPRRVEADATILALGGASWPRTGSDGAWVAPVQAAGLAVAPLRAANGGIDVSWTEVFTERFAGTPLKNVALSCAGTSVRGEAMVTTSGLEGGGIYALSRTIRDRLDDDGEAVLTIDLHPDVPAAQLTDRFVHRRPKDSVSTALRRAGLAPVAIGVLREATGNRLPDDPAAMARLVKAVPLRIVGLRPVGRAISTAGGLVRDEVDDRFMIRTRPGTFVAGEMLDWDAPTGGYLLQATFSTAVAAANGAIDWLSARDASAAQSRDE